MMNDKPNQQYVPTPQMQPTQPQPQYTTMQYQQPIQTQQPIQQYVPIQQPQYAPMPQYVPVYQYAPMQPNQSIPPQYQVVQQQYPQQYPQQQYQHIIPQQTTQMQYQPVQEVQQQQQPVQQMQQQPQVQQPQVQQPQAEPFIMPNLNTSAVDEKLKLLEMQRKEKEDLERVKIENENMSKLLNLKNECFQNQLDLSLIERLESYSPLQQLEIIEKYKPELARRRDELRGLNTLPKPINQGTMNNVQDKTSRVEALKAEIMEMEKKHPIGNDMNPDAYKRYLELSGELHLLSKS